MSSVGEWDPIQKALQAYTQSNTSRISFPKDEVMYPGGGGYYPIYAHAPLDTPRSVIHLDSIKGKPISWRLPLDTSHPSLWIDERRMLAQARNLLTAPVASAVVEPLNTIPGEPLKPTSIKRGKVKRNKVRIMF